MSIATPPRSIDLRGSEVDLHWDDGETTLDAGLLRRRCRCTDCRRQAGNGGPPEPPSGLGVTAATPVGRYGVQLHFSDGHDRGIYPWSYLRELGEAGAASTDG